MIGQFGISRKPLDVFGVKGLHDSLIAPTTLTASLTASGPPPSPPPARLPHRPTRRSPGHKPPGPSPVAATLAQLARLADGSERSSTGTVVGVSWARLGGASTTQAAPSTTSNASPAKDAA